MSKDTERSTDLALQADPLEPLKTKLKRQQMLLIGLLATCVLALLMAGTTLMMMLSDSRDLAAVEETEREQIQLINEQMAFFTSQVEALLARSEELGTELTDLSAQVATIDVNDQRNVLIRVQRILIRQEQDYRNFLTTLENGLYNFSMMIPHSRGWWEDYQKDLLETSELSKARENYVVNLRNN
ncbi:MAG: hypothetical protein V4751_12790 [Pseudomonadota bacterium]